jgi:protein-disulfide isomerase
MHKKEVAPVIPSREMIVGDPDAPVRLTVFGDYESAETRELNEIIKEVLENFKGNVNFVFRHFPMTRIHQRAHKAAEAAIGAGQEGKFWEMHQELLDHPHELGITALKSHAREVGVVNKKFLDQLINSDFGWYVQDDIREGIALGITEIPALLINGVMIEKPLSLSRIIKIIRKELSNQKTASIGKSKRKAA